MPKLYLISKSIYISYKIDEQLKELSKPRKSDVNTGIRKILGFYEEFI